jgi:hypothetical protein
MIIQAKSKSRIFFGWWIVLVTGIVSGLGLGFYIYGKKIFGDFAGLGLYSNDNKRLGNSTTY